MRPHKLFRKDSRLTLLVLTALLWMLPAASEAGSPLRFLKKLGTVIDTMAVKGVDPNYIESPERPWQVIVKGNVNQSELKMKTSGEIAGEPYHATPRLKTEPAQYVGLWGGYRGYGIGYTVNVGGDRGSYLTFGATGATYGVNVRIHTFRNDEPRYDLESTLIPEDEKESWSKIKLVDPIKVRTVIADAYYLFNGRHFSYCAAYDMSVIQRRSAGSLMVGGMYYYGHINYASHPNGDLVELMRGLGRVKLWQGSVGVGYAYNWVPARGLLVNVMAMPMLTFVNKIKAFGYKTNVSQLLQEMDAHDQDTDEEWDKWWYSSLRIEPMGDKTFSGGLTVNFDARLSLVYNVDRYFFNVYGQFYNFRYHHNGSRGRLSEWYVNAAMGVRL